MDLWIQSSHSPLFELPRWSSMDFWIQNSQDFGWEEKITIELDPVLSRAYQIRPAKTPRAGWRFCSPLTFFCRKRSVRRDGFGKGSFFNHTSPKGQVSGQVGWSPPVFFAGVENDTREYCNLCGLEGGVGAEGLVGRGNDDVPVSARMLGAGSDPRSPRHD